MSDGAVKRLHSYLVCENGSFSHGHKNLQILFLLIIFEDERVQ